MNDANSIGQVLVVERALVTSSSVIGHSLIMNMDTNTYYISYQGSNNPVQTTDISDENGDIQFYPQSDVLITFKCAITGKED